MFKIQLKRIASNYLSRNKIIQSFMWRVLRSNIFIPTTLKHVHNPAILPKLNLSIPKGAR